MGQSPSSRCDLHSPVPPTPSAGRINQGAYPSAIETLKEAVKQTPDSAAFHYHLGMAYEKANNHALAKKELEQALQISPNYSEANKIRKILGYSPLTIVLRPQNCYNFCNGICIFAQAPGWDRS